VDRDVKRALRSLAAVAVLAGLAVAVPGSAAAAETPRLGHVFVIVLENENADATFGPDAPPYLARTLPAKGAFVPNYFGIGHFSLDNYIAMISGQAPNPQTQADCQTFTDFLPGLPAADGQVLGSGCVYPSSVKTLADQLDRSGGSWHGYMEDMAAKVPAEPATCRHPAIGAQDDTQHAEVGDQYATRHNPFMYFHSIIDDKRSCDANVVDYEKLAGDLKRVRSTPDFSFITPNLCHDGHDEPCVDGEPGGLESANAFLRRVVPKILRSPAYERRGLLIVTFDEAEGAPGGGDSSACCGEQPGPNTANPGLLVPGPGGGRTGAVMLSPCIEPGTVSEQEYNHYSLLRSLEDGFGLSHLGYAAAAGLRPLGGDVYTRPDCGERMRVRAAARNGGAIEVRVRSALSRCTGGVRVSANGAEPERTDARGRATLHVSAGHHPKRVLAAKHGCTSDSARVAARH
jgi:hypothetical protein